MATTLKPLERIRAQRGLSIDAVAQGAGVAFETVKKLESTGRARILQLGKIARFLEVEPEELLFDQEEEAS